MSGMSLVKSSKKSPNESREYERAESTEPIEFQIRPCI